MTGHLKLYSCLCSETADHATQIPDTCQSHFSAVVAEVANDAPGGMGASHTCGERLCSGGIRDLGDMPSYLQPIPRESA